MEDSTEAPYDPSSAAAPAEAPAEAPRAVPVGGGRGRGRGRGRGGGGVAIEGIAELDASMGRGAPIPPAGGGGKPLPKKDQKDFRGPAGLFKQGDWTCTVCGNVNWERRSTCNKCQNPKPNLASTDEVGWVLVRAVTTTRFGSSVSPPAAHRLSFSSAGALLCGCYGCYSVPIGLLKSCCSRAQRACL